MFCICFVIYNPLYFFIFTLKFYVLLPVTKLIQDTASFKNAIKVNKLIIVYFYDFIPGVQINDLFIWSAL